MSVPRECGDDPSVHVLNDMGHYVFPASAGMILMSNDLLHIFDSVPRECGDDPTVACDMITGEPCSPRVRG